AVRGAAADLLLAITRRIPADDPRLAVHGDAAVLGTWLARTPF
ncbi:maleylpyruvate isomerase family mycothiol-dependent enzyme, partial [Pseudonocardia sp. KRD-188]|nr:maleylpyruvate isomerase family mycothiol-dependent enzyme [Pseudonocardia oceani]